MEDLRATFRPHMVAAFAFCAVLSACSSTVDPTLGIAPPQAVGTGDAALPAMAQPGAVAGRTGPVQFLPVVGAPSETVAQLSQALAASAAERGVAILPGDGPTAPFRLKGYLSALVEGQSTIVVYVWDVVDPQGTRISRIQGQERVGASAADPWSIVPASAIAAIAARTMEEFSRGPLTPG